MQDPTQATRHPARFFRFAVAGALALVLGCQQMVQRGEPASTGNPVTAGQAPDVQVAAMAPKPAQPGQLTSAEFLKQWREQKIGDLDGSVDVTAEVGRKIQASVAEVVSFATISLIDAESNSAAASTVSNGRGQFTLSMNGFIPDTGRAYYLEASKGLNGHMPGSPVVRFRTLVRWNGSSWESLSGSTISISSLTTAVSIAAQLAPSTFDPATLMNKINASVKPPILNRAPAAPTGFTDAQILGLATDVLAFLTANMDPIGALSDVAPAITYQSTDSARPGQTIEIRGKGFSPTATQNLVTFGGSSPGAILAGGTERLFVIVPADAATGSLVVTTPRGAVTGMTFYAGRANPVFKISRWFPAATFYQPGEEVTLLGFGFSNVPSGNTVVVGNVTTTPSTCDEQFLVFKVPEDATKGPISVRTSAGNSNELNIKIEFRPVIKDWFPRAGAPRGELQITGTNFGKERGTLTIGNTEASILAWTDTEISAAVANGSITGDLTVTRKTGGATSPGRFTVLSGTISSWQSSTTTNQSHQGGIIARKGRFLYAAGGYSSSNGYNSSVERCTLSDDGSLGGWSVMSGVSQGWTWNMYGGEGPSNQAQVIGNYFYAYAGYNPGGYGYNAVNRAQILDNGDFAGNFSPSGITMSQNIYYVGYFRRIRNYVYSFGGYWNTDIIQSAAINADGSLQPFQNVSRLPSAIYGGHFVTAGRYIYCLAGYRPWDHGHYGWMYRAEIDQNGAITNGFQYLSRSTPCNVYAGNTAVIGNYIYLFEGYDNNCTGSWNQGYVFRAPLDANDNLGNWQQVGSMPAGTHYPNYAIVGNKIHMWGHYANAHYGTIFTGTIN